MNGRLCLLCRLLHWTAYIFSLTAYKLVFRAKPGTVEAESTRPYSHLCDIHCLVLKVSIWEFCPSGCWHARSREYASQPINDDVQGPLNFQGRAEDKGKLISAWQAPASTYMHPLFTLIFQLTSFGSPACCTHFLREAFGGFFLFFNIYLFIWFWLCWVLIYRVWDP